MVGMAMRHRYSRYCRYSRRTANSRYSSDTALSRDTAAIQQRYSSDTAAHPQPRTRTSLTKAYALSDIQQIKEHRYQTVTDAPRVTPPCQDAREKYTETVDRSSAIQCIAGGSSGPGSGSGVCVRL
eukprot:2278641-Prymnesium_polylepis.1